MARRLPLGRTSIAIDFSGGTFSGLGHTPATFTTSDRAIQHIIETSEHFRSGRVKRILSVFDRLEEQQQHNAAEPPEPEPKCGKITYEASDPNDAADWLETQALISTEGITDPERLIEPCRRQPHHAEHRAEHQDKNKENMKCNEIIDHALLLLGHSPSGVRRRGRQEPEPPCCASVCSRASSPARRVSPYPCSAGRRP